MPQTPFSMPVRVYYEDTDAGGIVYHTSYLRFMERARTDMLRAAGFGHQRMADEFGLMFVAESMQVRFVRPAQLDDLLSVTAAIGQMGRASVVFEQTVMRGEEVIATASVRVACLRAADRKPTAMPAQLRDCLGACRT